MKFCPTCETSKPLSEFSRRSDRPDGYRFECKPCSSLRTRRWQEDNPERVRENGRRGNERAKAKPGYLQRKREGERRRLSDPAKRAALNARRAEWLATTEKGRTSYQRKRLRRFGITLEEWNAMVAKQKGRCAICKEIPPDTLHLDHDHTTGVIRGLLCGPCNHGLGRFRDDIPTMRAAIRYLQRAGR